MHVAIVSRTVDPETIVLTRRGERGTTLTRGGGGGIGWGGGVGGGGASVCARGGGAGQGAGARDAKSGFRGRQDLISWVGDKSGPGLCSQRKKKGSSFGPSTSGRTVTRQDGPKEESPYF